MALDDFTTEQQRTLRNLREFFKIDRNNKLLSQAFIATEGNEHSIESVHEDYDIPALTSTQKRRALNDNARRIRRAAEEQGLELPDVEGEVPFPDAEVLSATQGQVLQRNLIIVCFFANKDLKQQPSHADSFAVSGHHHIPRLHQQRDQIH